MTVLFCLGYLTQGDIFRYIYLPKNWQVFHLTAKVLSTTVERNIFGLFPFFLSNNIFKFSQMKTSELYKISLHLLLEVLYEFRNIHKTHRALVSTPGEKLKL